MSLFLLSGNMTRNPKTGTFQCPEIWKNHNGPIDASASLATSSSTTLNSSHAFPANGMTNTISNHWPNHENQSKFNVFAASANNKDNTNNTNAFSWIDSAAANSLSENLSELNIRDDRPRPTKIRRRNALTILDQHFPNPNTVKKPTPLIESQNSPLDAFEGASLLQCIEQNEKAENPKGKNKHFLTDFLPFCFLLG